jgi:F-type H+-transporting ATPase subunit gamma
VRLGPPEHRARGELIEKLTLTMNRVRQASITTEIIEVVSGAEALG